MKNLVSVVAAVVGFSSLGACGRASQSEDSQESGLFPKHSTPHAVEVAPSIFQLGNGNLSFNLYEYLKTVDSPLRAVATTPEPALVETFEAPEDFSPEDSEENLSLGLGKKGMFRVENNFIVTSDNQVGRITGQYYIDAFALGKNLSAHSHAFEVTTFINRLPLRAHLEARFLGTSIYMQDIADEKDFTVMRDFTSGFTAPLYTIPGLGLSAHATVGGELGVKAGSGLARTGKLVTDFMPHAGVNASLGGGIKALLFAKAEAVGSAVIMNTRIPLEIEINIEADEKFAGLFTLKPFAVDALQGTIDLIASVSVANVLPEGVRAAWAPVVTTVLGEDYQYKFNVWHSEGVKAAEVPGASVAF